MKFVVHLPKPRNPLVMAALRRKAGTHRKHRGSERQAAQRELARALCHAHPPSG